MGRKTPHTIRSRLRDAGQIGLPGGNRKTGWYRYLAPIGYNPSRPLPKGERGGYLDRFSNEWMEGPAHGLAAANEDIAEWDVQLSEKGETAWKRRAKEKKGQFYVNVTRLGLLSHGPNRETR